MIQIWITKGHSEVRAGCSCEPARPRQDLMRPDRNSKQKWIINHQSLVCDACFKPFTDLFLSWCCSWWRFPSSASVFVSSGHRCILWFHVGAAQHVFLGWACTSVWSWVARRSMCKTYSNTVETQDNLGKSTPTLNWTNAILFQAKYQVYSINSMKLKLTLSCCWRCRPWNCQNFLYCQLTTNLQSMFIIVICWKSIHIKDRVYYQLCFTLNLNPKSMPRYFFRCIA